MPCCGLRAVDHADRDGSVRLVLDQDVSVVLGLVASTAMCGYVGRNALVDLSNAGGAQGRDIEEGAMRNLLSFVGADAVARRAPVRSIFWLCSDWVVDGLDCCVRLVSSRHCSMGGHALRHVGTVGTWCFVR